MLDKRVKDTLMIMATVIVAFFIYGLAAYKSTLKLFQEKDKIVVEIIHTPQEEVRWIYVSGNSPAFTTGSLIQSEGKDCPIVHRIKWSVPPAGVLEVKVDMRDKDNKIVETLMKKRIMGPEE